MVVHIKCLTKNTWTFSPAWLILDRFLPYDRHLKDFPSDSDGSKEPALMQETQVQFLGGETWFRKFIAIYKSFLCSFEMSIF